MAQADLNPIGERRHEPQRVSDTEDDEARASGTVVFLWLLALLMAEVELLLWGMERAYA